ncbi:hypothetical protein EMIHUDRAFT_248848 [Emiliania huxleyi CCMP1516]|uniref:Uncharacterized protein n=2 Tax=Emiliania huxleyi TaxID=2903 RepID=A0A0D3ICH2_EMIH1|nr:hypothetical protein EMIHUDRAFT_248848 [Emiliania huxleyi CCMP1516]EOD08957.1 hypothetical protein EMIHUDRAFT_248848 [Emiliania huxleyi CCMP1516]|eukprot:XP_005761386.1 hypothetical protein EMIHUDRAFT_248848 [Emiliania huxleyi CCMP1516]
MATGRGLSEQLDFTKIQGKYLGGYSCTSPQCLLGHPCWPPSLLSLAGSLIDSVSSSWTPVAHTWVGTCDSSESAGSEATIVTVAEQPTSLRGTDPVTSLDLDERGLGPASATVIASLIAGNGVLQELYIGDNHIGDKGAAAIADALRGNGGAKALASALRVNAVLTNLNLGDNEISDEGAASIEGATLCANGVLNKLDVSRNEIGPTGAAAIADALKGNAVLTTLELAHNNKIGDEGAKAIGGALAVNGVLNKLWLGENNIGIEGAKAIGGALAGSGIP